MKISHLLRNIMTFGQLGHTRQNLPLCDLPHIPRWRVVGYCHHGRVHSPPGLSVDKDGREPHIRGPRKGKDMNGLNKGKFKALVHYVCEKADNPAVLGAVKLNKVLWYSDVVNYLITGTAITGESYVKRQHGPVARHLMKAIDELVAQGKIARGHVDHFGFMKHEYIAIQPADVSAFTPEEISLVDSAFEYVCLHHTAKSISEETHDVIWQLAEIGEEIPYYTVFAASVGEVDEADVAWARERFKDRVQDAA